MLKNYITVFFFFRFNGNKSRKLSETYQKHILVWKMGEVQTEVSATGIINGNIKFKDIPCVPKEKLFDIEALELMNETFSLKTNRGELIPVRLQIISQVSEQKYNFVQELEGNFID